MRDVRGNAQLRHSRNNRASQVMKSPTNAGDQAVEILHHRELLLRDRAALRQQNAW